MAARNNIYGNLAVRGTLSLRDFEFPTSDGSNGQVMVTDGGGNMTWVNMSGGTSGCCLDVFVTGGTYSGDTIILTNTTGGTVSITGITGGGSGSTNPGGSNTHVQWNDGGTFNGTSGLTWDGSEQFNVASNYSGSTQKLSVGKANLAGLADYDGVGMDYKNPLSGGTSGLWSGNLSAVSGQDNHTVLGYADLMSGEQHMVSISPTDGIDLTSASDSTSARISAKAGQDVRVDISNTATTSFLVYTQTGGHAVFQANTQGEVTINAAYTFPTVDGNNGQVLQTDGGGFVTWEDAASGGTGGTSLFTDSGGTQSTLRIGAGTANGQYSTISGGYGNNADGRCATVGGGGANTADGWYGTVAGGRDNTASGYYSVVAGGRDNTASSQYSVVAGGSGNTVGSRATVGGGVGNCASGGQATVGGGYHNTASGQYSVVAGGGNMMAGGNTASGYVSFIGGGANNTASNYYATVAGGIYNLSSGSQATIAGGCGNIASGTYATVAGGRGNAVSTNASTIGGGLNNVVSTNCSVIAGGFGNCVTSSAYHSAIGGGVGNHTCGQYSTISGGYGNTISSTSTCSGIVGGKSNVISANTATFIVGDNINSDRDCTTFVNNLSIMSIPTSAAGLPQGAVWADGGVLTIVGGP